MKKLAIALFGASALTLPAAASAAPQVQMAAKNPVVELTITESVEAAPDMVTIGAGVTSEAPTATEALRMNSAQMIKVIARIKALGIPEKDIRTTGISVAPQYDYRDTGQVFRGYQAANRVSVVLRRIEETGRVLDALVEAGATDISGPDFGIENDTSAKEEARSRAVARGTAQARAYAKMLGYEGVKVLSVAESIEFYAPMPEARKSTTLAIDAAAPPPVQPGMVASGVSVTMTWELTGPGPAETR